MTSSSSSSGVEPVSTGAEQHLCGEDGAAQGPIVLRSNGDVAALSGCMRVEGDLYIDPCRVCFDDDARCSSCTKEEAAQLTSLDGLGSLERITGRLVVGWAEENWRAGPCTGPTALHTLEGLAGLREVDGNLELNCAPGLTSASLPQLKRAGVPSEGELSVAVHIPVDAEFPELQEVATLILMGPTRTKVGTPKLEKVHGYVHLWDTSISTLEELRALREVHGRFRLWDTPVADLGPVGRLQMLGGLELIGNVPLVDLALPSIGGQFDSLLVGSLPSIETISLSQDATEISGVHLAGNPRLAVFSAPGLRESAWFYIGANESFASFAGLPALERVSEDLRISSNPALCMSVVNSFVEGLEVDGAIVHVYGNGDC